MGIRNGYNVPFSPKGITDAFDCNDSFPGACMSLSNLIFDTGNPDQVVARPGVGTAITSFAGFNAPSYVSLQQTIGQYTYGMVASARNPGFDEPFVWDNVNLNFITVSGVTAGNTPSSPSTSGAWTPPTLTIVGKKVIITHPGFSGVGSNFFGVIDITTPSAPAWSAHNTGTNALPSVPTSVANFNNRARFACGNLNYGTDVLDPLTVTNLNNTVTVSDTTAITAQVGLPVQTTSGGVASALLIFKGEQIWQLTGDSVSSNLALNFISLTIGTNAPRSVAQTPMGVVFAGVDSCYIVNPLGSVSELRNPRHDAADVREPFQNCTVPSRMSAGYVSNIYRVCLTTVLNGSTVTNDYWFDFRRMRWNGPHTFPYDCVSPYNGYFLVTGPTSGAALFKSIVADTSLNTTYNDNGAAISVTLQTAYMPIGDIMEFIQVVESIVSLSSGGISVTFNITAVDDLGNTLATAQITTLGTGAVWGAFTWGDGTVYTATNLRPHKYDIQWNQPIVFNRLSLIITATSSSDVTIGKIVMRYQNLGYATNGALLGV